VTDKDFICLVIYMLRDK